MKQYMRITEFANRIGVCVNTLRSWDSKGILKPALRLPGSNIRLYAEEQVEQYFKVKTQIPEALASLENQSKDGDE